MRIDVRDRELEATEALEDYVGLRLLSVLDQLVRPPAGRRVRAEEAEGAPRPSGLAGPSAPRHTR